MDWIINFHLVLFSIRTKNGTELSNVPILKDDHGSRYEIKDNKLIIKRLTFEDDGKYICSNPDTKESAEINVVGKHDKNNIKRPLVELRLSVFTILVLNTISYLFSAFSQCLHQKAARKFVGCWRWKAENSLHCIGHRSRCLMARWYVGNEPLLSACFCNCQMLD